MWNTIVGKIQSNQDPVIDLALGGALGSFRAPNLIAKSLDFALTGKLSASAFESLGRGIHFETKQNSWRWLTRNFEHLKGRYGASATRVALSIGRHFCRLPDATKIQAFLIQNSALSPNIKTRIAKTVMAIEHCSKTAQVVSSSLGPRLRQMTPVPGRKLRNQ